MNIDDYPGAFSPGIDNETWTYSSIPVKSKEELELERLAQKRQINEIIEWRMNHVDSCWGEKLRPKIIVPPPTPDQISKRPLQVPAQFPDERDINHYTVNDVKHVYGLDSDNLKLLDTITARTSRISAAIGYINDTEQRLDLNQVVRTVPFLSKRLREVLTTALNEEMKDDLGIIAELNKYIYSEEPAQEPETNPEEGEG